MASLSKKSNKNRRIDELLCERGLVDSLKSAQAYVLAGKVTVNEQRADKPSLLVDTSASIRLKNSGKFVSRGGDKLAGALLDLGIADALLGATVLDVGASTGGFTDCCLQNGAKTVIAVDVGTNQLAWELRNDPRVRSYEKTDIRELRTTGENLEEISWVVADVSFNSLARLLPQIRRVAPAAGVHFLLLVKPQFELPRDLVESGGLVTDEGHRQLAVERIATACAELGLAGGRITESKIPGQSGNREIFYYVKSSERFVE